MNMRPVFLTVYKRRPHSANQRGAFKPLSLSKWLGVFNSPTLLAEGELLCGMLGEDGFLGKGHFNWLGRPKSTEDQDSWHLGALLIDSGRNV